MNDQVVDTTDANGTVTCTESGTADPTAQTAAAEGTLEFETTTDPTPSLHASKIGGKHTISAIST